ncbi:MAG: (2Fe-2S)-binding protein [Puniceicoccales bacterium]|jgi:ferredoxin|nr:(2Fe-2S)-binding protein [Puniceicoccales bacterium]
MDYGGHGVQKTVIIDGKAYPFEEERSVLELCLRNDIAIPHLCNREGLSVEATCGLCFIEQKVQEKWVPVLSCVLKPIVGMKVRTQSEAIDSVRRLSAMNLLRIHRVHCECCRELGKCFLQKIYNQVPCGLTMELAQEKDLGSKVAPLGKSTLGIDRQKCVGCGLCVRYVQEVFGEDWLTIETLPHGFRRIDVYPDVCIPPEKNTPLIELCPVHALSDSRQRLIKVYDSYKIDHGVTVTSEYVPKNDLWHQRHQFITSRVKRDDTPLELREMEARKELTEQEFKNKGRLLYPFVHGQPVDVQSSLLQVFSILSTSQQLGIILSGDLCLEDILLLSRWCGYRKPAKIFLLDNTSSREKRYPPSRIMSHRVFSDLGLGDVSSGVEGLSELNRDVETQKIDALWIFNDVLCRGLKKEVLCGVPSIYMGSDGNPTNDLCDFVLPTSSFCERAGWIVDEEDVLCHFLPDQGALEGVYEEWKWMAMMINIYCDYEGDEQKYMTRASLWSELQIHYPALRDVVYDALPHEGISIRMSTGAISLN